MTCKLAACTEKSTNSNMPTQSVIIGSIVGLGLAYLAFSHFSKRK